MDELITALRPHAINRFVKKGTVMLYQSEIPRHALIVRKGLVRAYTITSAGEERIVSLHTKNDVLALSWVFGETRNSLFYYEAVENSEIISVPKDQLIRITSANPKFTQSMLSLVINGYTALLLRVTALEQSSAAEKIALTLYYLIIRHGSEKKPGAYTINIKMTQSMIASLVGLTRESTAVNLKLLKKKQIVNYSSFVYTVNKENLERFVGEDSFKDLQLD